MSDLLGRFVWYELMTTDVEAARAFYQDVVGWRAEDAKMPGMTYLLLHAGAAQVAGMMGTPEEAKGAPPHWSGYAAVEDVDASAEQVKQLGGAIHVPPTDIPEVGRFAVAADPDGAVFSLFTGLKDSDNTPANAEKPGHVGWNELMATDQAMSFQFYSALFGWAKEDALDMGEMGTYQIFSAHGRPIGGMMNRPPMVPRSHWLYYFNVPDIDIAVERAKTGGAQILHGPSEVPGGGWIVQALDPQKAMFALVGRRA